MANVLKGWLADNTVTTDNKDDKILVLESAGSLTEKDILERMMHEITGLKEETLNHAVTLYNRIIMESLLNGYTVNTGLFYASPSFQGVIDGGTWNKEKNSIKVNFQQGKTLREDRSGRQEDRSERRYSLTRVRLCHQGTQPQGGWHRRVRGCLPDQRITVGRKTARLPDHQEHAVRTDYPDPDRFDGRALHPAHLDTA